MRTPIFLSALLFPALLAASAQLQNHVQGTPLGLIAGGGYISGTVQVRTNGGTSAVIGVAIGDATDAYPGPSAFWIVGDSTPPASTPVHTCPNPGWWDGYTQPMTSVWHTVNLGGWMPYGVGPNCSAKKYFIVAAQYPLPGLSGCSFEAIIAVPFTYNSAAGCPSATPTRTPTQTRTPFVPSTATLTPTPGGPFASPTPTLAGVIIPTATPTPGVPPATAAAGPGAEAVRVVRALMVPNPNPSRVFFDLRGTPDEVKVSVYSSAFTKVWESTAPGAPAGWRSAPVQFPPVPGVYFVKVAAMGGGGVKSSYAAVAWRYN